MSTHPTPDTRPADSGGAEVFVQVLILLAVAGMAGAASFTHVHDWTMHNSPRGTGDWFGWANACVTELTPLAAGLEVRRRRRRGQPAGAYPVLIILGAIALSLAGQFAEAKPSVSGWIISAVPALGFLALVKLVLSRPTMAAAVTTPEQVPAPELVDEHTTPEPVTVVDPVPDAPVPVDEPTPAAPDPAPVVVDPAPVALAPLPRPAPVLQPARVLTPAAGGVIQPGRVNGYAIGSGLAS